MRKPLVALLLAVGFSVAGVAAARPPARAASSEVARRAKQVIVLVAMPGAGKTTVADIAAQMIPNASKWSSGDVIRQTMAERGMADTPENNKIIRKEFGAKPGEVGRRLAAQIAKTSEPIAIVEGFRPPADLVAFRKSFPDAKVVAIEVSAKRRYPRMLDRGRNGENTVAILAERDQGELDLGVRETMKAAQYRFRPRADSKEELAKEVSGLLERIGVAPPRVAAAN